MNHTPMPAFYIALRQVFDHCGTWEILSKRHYSLLLLDVAALSRLEVRGFVKHFKEDCEGAPEVILRGSWAHPATRLVKSNSCGIEVLSILWF